MVGAGSWLRPEGGGDGVEIFLCAAQLQRELGSDSPFQVHLVSGPLMASEHRSQLDEIRKSLKSITLHEFIQPLPAWMKRVDLVLSMGGYNTLCEVMSVARRSLVIPRVHPRREQEIRARALELAGILTVHPLAELTPASLETSLRGALEMDPQQITANRPPMTGIECFQQRIRTLADRLPLTPPATGKRSTRRASRRRQDTSGDAPRHQPLLKIEKSRRAGRGGSRRTLSRFSPKNTGGPPRPGAGLFAVLLPLLLLLGAPARGLDATPNELQATLQMGHDSNLLNASDAERDAFENASPEAFFVVDSMEDVFLQTALEGSWRLGRLGRMKQKLTLGYERIQFMENPIKSEESFALTYQLRVTSRSRLKMNVKHRPQVYGRHRRDKDADPGTPQFRAETHRRWDLGLELRHSLSDTWRAIAEVYGSHRDYSIAFDERDRLRLGGSIEIERTFSPAFSGGTQLGWRDTKSSNEPDLGKDLSCQEWSAMPFIELYIHHFRTEIEGSLEFRWRKYASDDPEDWNHYRRNDRFGAFALTMAQRLSPSFALMTSYRTAWRSAKLDSGLDVDYDEEGAFSEQVISGGLRWYWERQED